MIETWWATVLSAALQRHAMLALGAAILLLLAWLLGTTICAMFRRPDKWRVE